MIERYAQRSEPIDWLLASAEPWTRYRVLVDLLDRPAGDPEVEATRLEMLSHPQVASLASDAAPWGQRPLKRHNDASHPIYKLSTLADFGIRAQDGHYLDNGALQNGYFDKDAIKKLGNPSKIKVTIEKA